MNLRAARSANIVLGIWLFVSAFLWPHSIPQFNNAWVVGLLAVLFAGVAMAVPVARYINAALAVWLFLSIWALPALTLGTLWNSGIVAILMFIASLVGRGERAAPPPRATRRAA